MTALVESQSDANSTRCGRREALQQRVSEAGTRLRRLQSAIEAEADPAALVEAINTAQAERAAAQGELDNAPETRVLSAAEVQAMVDSLGDVGAALSDAEPGKLSRLYQNLGMI